VGFDPVDPAVNVHPCLPRVSSLFVLV